MPRPARRCGRTYTIPAPGEPGSETWPKGDQWKTGGGSVWVTGVYDPETNLTFWGTGNPGPWMGDQRPGDNLYTTSVMALDAATGKIKGHHQYHQNNSWDWDEVSPPIIVDYTHDGKTVKGLVDVARRRVSLDARADRRQDQFRRRPAVCLPERVHRASIRRPAIRSSRRNTSPAPARWPISARACGAARTGRRWRTARRRKLLYIPANENLCGAILGRPVTYIAGSALYRRDQLALSPQGRRSHRRTAGLEPRHRQEGLDASLRHEPELGAGAGDRRRCAVRGRHQRPQVPRAWTRRTARCCTRFGTASGVNGVPMSFQVDGKQYVAVQSGWGVDAARMQLRLNLVRPGAVSRGAAGRLDLGVRCRLGCRGCCCAGRPGRRVRQVASAHRAVLGLRDVL